MGFVIDRAAELADRPRCASTAHRLLKDRSTPSLCAPRASHLKGAPRGLRRGTRQAWARPRHSSSSSSPHNPCPDAGAATDERSWFQESRQSKAQGARRARQAPPPHPLPWCGAVSFAAPHGWASHERDSQGVYDSASPVRAWSRARLTPSPCSRARCLLSPFAGCRSRSADRLDLAGASAFPEWAG